MRSAAACLRTTWPSLPLQRNHKWNRGCGERGEPPTRYEEARLGPCFLAAQHTAFQPRRQSFSERYIAGVPARIMRPRLIFMACLFTLVCFGLLMVYSASSVEALHENGSATFFLGRQAAFAVVGVLALIAIVRVLPDSWFGEDVLRIFLIGMIGLLFLVFLVGSGSRGATRWLNIAGIQFQPSEFLKPFAIAYSAIMLDRFFSPGGNINEFLRKMGIYLGISLFLIFIQPDFGTVLIILLTLMCMALFAGLDPRFIIGVLIFGILVIVIALVAEPYRMVRIQVA